MRRADVFSGGSGDQTKNVGAATRSVVPLEALAIDVDSRRQAPTTPPPKGGGDARRADEGISSSDMRVCADRHYSDQGHGYPSSPPGTSPHGGEAEASQGASVLSKSSGSADQSGKDMPEAPPRSAIRGQSRRLLLSRLARHIAPPQGLVSERGDEGAVALFFRFAETRRERHFARGHGDRPLPAAFTLQRIGRRDQAEARLATADQLDINVGEKL